MDKKEYLKLCQKASVYVSNKIKIPNELLLTGYEEYYPFGYEITFKNGQIIHRAILHELNNNSIIYVGIDKISRLENSNGTP